MKDFKKMSFVECMDFSKNELDEIRYPAKIYACNETLNAYVIECYSEICDSVERWFHFYVRDVCTFKPVCFRAVNNKKIADKLWEWYTRPY